MEQTKEQPVKKGFARVKILKFVGNHQPGDIIDVPQEMADVLCEPSTINLGDGKTDDHRKAILLSEAEAMDSAPVDIRRLSSKELADLGKKNIVPTPRDSAFDARLAQMQKGKKIQSTGTLSEEAIEKESAQPEWVPGAEDEKAEATQAEGEQEAGAEVEEGESAAPEASDQEPSAADKKKAEAAAKKAKAAQDKLDKAAKAGK